MQSDVTVSTRYEKVYAMCCDSVDMNAKWYDSVDMNTKWCDSVDMNTKWCDSVDMYLINYAVCCGSGQMYMTA